MDMFVRQINRGRYDRWYPPIDNRCPPHLRGFQSELAYSLVETVWQRDGNFFTKISGIEEMSISKARARLSAFRVRHLPDGSDIHSVDPVATLEIANRIRTRLSFLRRNIVFQPRFPGCGIVSAAVGDLSAEDLLLEIKNVERGFRATDVRQVLLYSALHFEATGQYFSELEIGNFAQGQIFTIPSEELASSVSGTRAPILFHSILDAISMPSGST